MVPQDYRIPFSEVFPHPIVTSILPMWAWGLILLIPAALAFAFEQRLSFTGRERKSWRIVYGSHMVLAATYIALSACALLQGIGEITWSPWNLALGNILSAISRPVLWGYVGYLHTTYARMPIPEVSDD